MKRKPFTLFIHIALTVIFVGAMCTHFFGIQGDVTIADRGKTSTFAITSGPGGGVFPFEVELVSADVEFYPGTTTPMDFKSLIRINNRNYEVSMNNPAVVEGWRFYQSGMTADSSTFSISYDPFGIGITYCGYMLLAIGLVGFFFQRNTAWSALIRRRTAIVTLLIFVSFGSANSAELPTMQRSMATDMGKMYVYWNDRICPMQTMARDVTIKLYGSEEYKGMTPEQVLSGWLFYFDEWLRDYVTNNPEISDSEIDKSQKKLLERKTLITILGTGEAFRIYPYVTAEGYTDWLSLTGHRPAQMGLEQWKFMQTTMPRIKELLLLGKNIKADEEIMLLIENQKKYAGRVKLPSENKIIAEILYNRMARPFWGGVIAIILSVIYLYIGLSRRKSNMPIMLVAVSLLYLTTGAVVCAVIVSWWLSGHVPLSNGTEMMLFMATISLLIALTKKDNIIRGALILIAAMSLMVAGMASKTPQIGSLMPVLASSLLAVHVMFIMCAYVLFLLMAVLSLIALISKSAERKEDLSRLNRIILTPAVSLLAVGIMIGAVWANKSWGRYWGWDPKETCALLMLLIYAVPLHWAYSRLSWFRKPDILHRYLLIAIGTVLFTYFGANFLIPGLHSYA